MVPPVSLDAPTTPPPPAPASWTQIALVLLTFAALSIGSAFLPHDPYVRYQQLTETIQFPAVWGYERIVFDPAPIDVAVVGNSRLQAAISAPQLSQELSQSLGRPVTVANLSMPQEGRNAHYAIVRNLLEHRPEVKLIILSAIEQMPREGHPAFRSIAEAGDLATAPLLINRDFLKDAAQIPFRQMSLFVQTQMPAPFGVTRQFRKQEYFGTGYDSTFSFRSPTGNFVDRDSIVPAADLLPPARARAESITPPLLPASAADMEFTVERVYTRKIAEMARAKGVRVAFLYAPIYHYPLPLKDQSFYEAIGPVLQEKFLSAHPDWYSDYGHLNRRGAVQSTTALGTFIAAQGLLKEAE
ncbi:MAG: hypothetical protein B7Y36_17795 [Novosphingobium sp. 28-62-57]|nr:MAG: hypothetical protein B7Z36_03255 [Novosphingobium sp. 12-63-9]OYZ08161.1 MAG: hypothetical protein B7Y36_17795 [Novosphingobium sp. 28-62-57]OZA35823.1 MAG: hypothetical protein B7X92_08930 [Novosphingobium sp. 17-62-9]